MFDKNTLDSVYQDIAEGGYLDDWVLNCARAMRDQAVTAIELAAENERLKDERKRLIENNTILSDALDRANAKLGEIRDMCLLASGKGESYETSWFSGYSYCADEIMAIIDKDGDET